MDYSQLIRKFLFFVCLLVSTFSFSQVTEEWVRSYDGPGNNPDNNLDHANSVAVDAQGNVYVTGYSYGIGINNPDYATIKYDADGNELWVRRYNGPRNGIDIAIALAVDNQGNVYVTGRSQQGDPGLLIFDYATIKYDTDGTEVWIRRYNGPANSDDAATALAIDTQGNVHVTGSSIASNGFPDYATIKYDAAGTELWVRRYNGPGNGNDGASSLAVDAQGNVYVTGGSDGSESSGSFGDYATIKYDAAGTELWVRRYNGPGNGNDGASSLAVDAQGNVYVTGSIIANNGFPDYTTIKFDTDGNELWIKKYDGPESLSHDAAQFIALDVQGNVYVTGESNGNVNHDSFNDYTTIKYDAAGNELWVRMYNGPQNDIDFVHSLAVDDNGNVYVTGSSAAPVTGIDYATVKYDTDGNEQWVQRYNGSGNLTDEALDLAVDDNGNVYVTGSSLQIDGDNFNQNYTTIKYSQAEGLVVSSFTLINADTDEDIRELKDGDVVDLSTLPTRNLTVRANTTPALVGSVVFQGSGQLTYRHTENVAPYTLLGNNKEDYYGFTPQVGTYTLTATPYEGKRGTGNKGNALTITVTAVDHSITHLGAANKLQQPGMETNKGINLHAAPNPSPGQTNITFSVPHSGHATLDMTDIKGSVVKRLYNAQAEKEHTYRVSFDGGHLPSGVYILRLVSGRHTQVLKLVLMH